MERMKSADCDVSRTVGVLPESETPDGEHGRISGGDAHTAAMPGYMRDV